MNRKRNSLAGTLLSAALLITSAMPAFAHGGFDHVIGNVAAVTGDVLTVKTSTGNVDVKLDAKTGFTRGDQKAQISDLKPGVRVTIDIPEGSKEKIAHAVKLGAGAAAAAHDEHGDHDGHK